MDETLKHWSVCVYVSDTFVNIWVTFKFHLIIDFCFCCSGLQQHARDDQPHHRGFCGSGSQADLLPGRGEWIVLTVLLLFYLLVRNRQDLYLEDKKLPVFCSWWRFVSHVALLPVGCSAIFLSLVRNCLIFYHQNIHQTWRTTQQNCNPSVHWYKHFVGLCICTFYTLNIHLWSFSPYLMVVFLM